MHFSILFAAAGLSQLRHKEARGRAMWAEREVLRHQRPGPHNQPGSEPPQKRVHAPGQAKSWACAVSQHWQSSAPPPPFPRIRPCPSAPPCTGIQQGSLTPGHPIAAARGRAAGRSAGSHQTPTRSASDFVRICAAASLRLRKKTQRERLHLLWRWVENDQTVAPPAVTHRCLHKTHRVFAAERAAVE